MTSLSNIRSRVNKKVLLLKSSKANTLGVRSGNMPYWITGPTFSLQPVNLSVTCFYEIVESVPI